MMTLEAELPATIHGLPFIQEMLGLAFESEIPSSTVRDRVAFCLSVFLVVGEHPSYRELAPEVFKQLQEIGYSSLQWTSNDTRSCLFRGRELPTVFADSREKLLKFLVVASGDRIEAISQRIKATADIPARIFENGDVPAEVLALLENRKP